MSQRVDERTHTKDCLAVYTKILELTKYSMEVCKPKVKKDKNGKNRESNHHVPTRYSRIGDRLVDTLLDIGGIVLEANEIYIGSNLNTEERIANLKRRIRWESDVISDTYYIEHIVRALNDHKRFADSTFNYWVGLIVETRRLAISWRDSDKKILKGCEL